MRHRPACRQNRTEHRNLELAQDHGQHVQRAAVLRSPVPHRRFLRDALRQKAAVRPAVGNAPRFRDPRAGDALRRGETRRCVQRDLVTNTKRDARTHRVRAFFSDSACRRGRRRRRRGRCSGGCGSRGGSRRACPSGGRRSRAAPARASFPCTAASPRRPQPRCPR